MGRADTGQILKTGLRLIQISPAKQQFSPSKSIIKNRFNKIYGTAAKELCITMVVGVE